MRFEVGMEDANDAPGCAACEASPLTLPTELLSTTVDRLAAIEVTKVSLNVLGARSCMSLYSSTDELSSLTWRLEQT